VSTRPSSPRRTALTLDEAAERISAYVYGNLLALAALVVLSFDDVEAGHGTLVVAGTGASTFAAHAFAEVLGARVRSAGATVSLRTVLRDSVPILSAAAVPALILVLGWQDVLSPSVALRIAEVWILGRIALTSFFVGRLQGRAASLWTLLASIALTAVAVLVVALKIVLTH